MSGFLHGHSCCSALLKLTDDWRQAVDNEKDVAVVAIGPSIAFDSICHNLLLGKLKAYDVHDWATGRWLPLRCGVPQGAR